MNTTTAPTATTQPAGPAKILIVDDAIALRSMLRAFFKSEGYNVVGELSNGAGVMDAIERMTPDVVCLDINLPDISGLDLLKTIHAAKPEIAVIMISGSTAPSVLTSASAAGAAGFIRKPFTQSQLAAEVGQALHTQRLQRQEKINAPANEVAIRARAVVVDDSATMRLLLIQILRRAGIEVVAEATDGHQGIDMVTEHQPDIVCLDMEMPRLSGIDALKQIQINVPTAKVLMITGHAGRDTVMRAAQYGAKGYILKPFKVEQVILVIDRLLAS